MILRPQAEGVPARRVRVLAGGSAADGFMTTFAKMVSSFAVSDNLSYMAFYTVFGAKFG